MNLRQLKVPHNFVSNTEHIMMKRIQQCRNYLRNDSRYSFNRDQTPDHIVIYHVDQMCVLLII
jgi:hypothetical protein